MADVSEELDRLAISGPPVEVCLGHDSQPLSYFCVTCTVAVCSDCAMFGEHKGHQFEKLDDVYRRHCSAINDEAAQLHARVKTLLALTEGVERQIEAVTRAKEERSAETKAAADQMQARLDAQLRARLVALLSHKRSMTDELDLLESMLGELRRQMKVRRRTAPVARSALTHAVCALDLCVRRFRPRLCLYPSPPSSAARCRSCSAARRWRQARDRATR